jgi:hypothetical protein
MTEKWLRFGVSDGQSLWSATWKLWAGSDAGAPEILLASRSLGGRLQAGRRHASQNWAVTFVPATDRGPAGPPLTGRRDVGHWPQPSRISETCVLLFRILTPATSVTPPPVRGKHRYVAWIPRAPPGRTVETAIFVTAPTNGVLAWPTRELAGRSLLGSFELVTGDRVSVLYRTIASPDFAAHARGPMHVLRTASGGSPRSLAIGVAPDGSPAIYDLAVAPGADRAADLSGLPGH